jgi:hypothetical protein
MSTGYAKNSSRWTMSNQGRTRDRAPVRGGALTQQKKEAQIQDRQSATADYAAVRLAQRDNMARLQALRLARDAAEALCVPAEVVPAQPKQRTKKAAVGARPRRGSKASA